MEDKSKFISPGDLELVKITDDPQEAIQIILDYERRVGPPEIVPKAFAYQRFRQRCIPSAMGKSTDSTRLSCASL